MIGAAPGKERLDFRTALFVPANRPGRYKKAADASPGAVILDLEDSVAAPDKDSARSALRTDFTRLPVILRMNSFGSPWFERDLEAAASLPFTGLMVPKSADIGELEQIAAGAAGRLPIVALIETARGVAEARRIAALPQVARLAFGSIDYCADLDCEHSREALLAARSELVLASRLAGKPAPLDGVTASIDDLELVEADAHHGRSLGFGGKMCIHPHQIEPVLRGYQPTQAELEWAGRVLDSTDGAIRIDGAMVDEPVRMRARQILTQANR